MIMMLNRSFGLIAVIACMSMHLLVASAASAAQLNPLQAAESALGGTTIKSLQFSAIGMRSQFSQSLWTAYPYMPVRAIKNYQASIDFEAKRLRVEAELTTSPTGGYFVGEQRWVELLSDGFAWSESTQPMGRSEDPSRPAAQPQPDALSDRLLWLWAATPQGVLKAAANAVIKTVDGGAELSFKIGSQPVTAFLNQMNQVVRVEAPMPNPVLGDTRLVIRYTGYRDFGGIQFPTMISEYQDEYPIFQLAVTDVQINPAVAIQVPDNVRAFKVPVRAVTSQQIADGVSLIAGASHSSMVVDMGDHIAVIEAPLDEARSNAVIAEVHKLLPGKPIRYVLNTHVHFDHAGGLRTYVDEGATVVTHLANRAFYEKAWAAPHTLQPDRLSKSGKRAKFMTVEDHAAIKGANGRTIELHHLQGNPHNEESLVIWLPNERILFQSDMINGAANRTPAARPTPVATNFYDNLQRLKIMPLQIVSGHGSRILTMADLNAAAGKATSQ